MGERLTWVPRPLPGVEWRLVDGTAVAVTERDQVLHTFQGPVATFIWTQIDGRRTMGQILDGVLSCFEVEPGQAFDDLVQFVQLLKGRGLIDLEATPAPGG